MIACNLKTLCYLPFNIIEELKPGLRDLKEAKPAPQMFIFLLMNTQYLIILLVYDHNL